MSKKKKQEENNQAQEPLTSYSEEQDKTIRFFSSFEEMDKDKVLRMARRTGKERLELLEEMREIFLSQYLQEDGSWPRLKRTISITYKEEA